ncbi:MAG: MFS transporter, partial [Planctomycetes bacterium]|nr:MFS transporter [Planctomycetota bacterium]
MTHATSAPIATSRWGVLALAAIGIIMATLDTSIVNVALPVIAADLGCTVNQASWIQTTYLMVITTALVPAGRCADLAGYRRAYFGGLTAFTVGSIFCALAPNLLILALARCVQGLGGAVLLAFGGPMLVLSFPPEQRGRALSAIPVSVAIGVTLGPIAGGLLTTHLSWHWIFWVNIPIGIAALWLTHIYIIPTANPGWRALRKQLNLTGIAAIAAFVACFVIGTNIALEADRSWTDPDVLALLLALIPLLVVILVINKRAPEQLLPLSLFRSRIFTGSLLASVVSLVMLFAIPMLLAYQMQRIQGFDVELASYVLLTSPVCLVTCGPVAGWISDRFGSDWPRLFGITLAGIGVYALSTLTDQHGPWDVVWRIMLYSGGIGFFQTPNNHVSYNSLENHQLAVATG